MSNLIRTLILKRQLTFIRFLTWKRDCSEDCWKYIVKEANCEKEAKLLDNLEEIGLCIPNKLNEIDAPKEIPEIFPITGVPSTEQQRNTAIIRKPAKNVMQQGTANTQAYVLSYASDVTWENPLMGWTSGSNSLKDVEIQFPTKESALQFAKKNGWAIIMLKEYNKKSVVKDYGKQFSWNKRTRTSTK